MIRTALLLMPILSVTPVLYGALIVDRGLPTDNLNQAAGSSRSNVAWGDNPAFDATFNVNWTYGDTFTVGSAGQSYLISSLRVWIVGDPSGTALNQIFSSLSLLGGALGSTPSAAPACGNTTGSNCFDASNITVLKTGATGAGDITVVSTTYSNAQGYQNIVGGFNNIYQVDFNNLNWLVAGGTTYLFAVNGVPGSVGNGGNSPRLSASNAGFGGVVAEGSDGVLWELGTNLSNNGVVADSWSSLTSAAWDKDSDINVQVFGAAVPEPSTMVLLGSALAALGGIRRLGSRKRS